MAPPSLRRPPRSHRPVRPAPVLACDERPQPRPLLGRPRQRAPGKGPEPRAVRRGQRLGVLLGDARDQRRNGLGAEGLPQGHRLVQDAAQRPNVAPLVVRPAVAELGAQVVRRAHHRARERVTAVAQSLGQPKVGELDGALALAREEDVGRLDVAVQDPSVVHVRDGADELHQPRAHQPLRNELLPLRLRPDHTAERAAVGELEHDVQRAGLHKVREHPDDVGVAEAGHDGKLVADHRVVRIAPRHALDDDRPRDAARGDAATQVGALEREPDLGERASADHAHDGVIFERAVFERAAGRGRRAFAAARLAKRAKRAAGLGAAKVRLARGLSVGRLSVGRRRGEPPRCGASGLVLELPAARVERARSGLGVGLRRRPKDGLRPPLRPRREASARRVRLAGSGLGAAPGRSRGGSADGTSCAFDRTRPSPASCAARGRRGRRSRSRGRAEARTRRGTGRSGGPDFPFAIWRVASGSVRSDAPGVRPDPRLSGSGLAAGSTKGFGLSSKVQRANEEPVATSLASVSTLSLRPRPPRRWRPSPWPAQGRSGGPADHGIGGARRLRIPRGGGELPPTATRSAGAVAGSTVRLVVAWPATDGSPSGGGADRESGADREEDAKAPLGGAVHRRAVHRRAALAPRRGRAG